MLVQDERRYLARQRRIRQLKRRIVVEANRLLSGNLVDYRSSSLYYVYPAIYEVEKKNGFWVCQCEVFKKYGICEHSVSVELKEMGYS